MFSCPSCHRHVRETEPECPFCGAAIHVDPTPSWLNASAFALASALFFGSSACAVGPGVDTEGGTTTTTGTSETVADTSTQESTEENGEWQDPTEDPDTSLSFYAPPEDDWGGVSECDPWAQDCPEGEKCVPYASTAQTWDSNKCVQIMGSGQVGDLCTYGGFVEATDDCDFDSHCWGVNEDNIGTCHAFCGGTVDEPVCDMGECVIANDGSITLCFDSCNPLAPEEVCIEGQTCAWTNIDFNCVWLDEMPAAPGEACSTITGCEPGSNCVNGEALPACDGAACCAEFCDIDDPMACASDPMLECVPYFENDAPEGYETLGLCLAPPP